MAGIIVIALLAALGVSCAIVAAMHVQPHRFQHEAPYLTVRRVSDEFRTRSIADAA